MTESPDPHDLGELDRGSFVGDAPAGDATPGEVTSNDQSASSTRESPDGEPDEQTSGDGNEAGTTTEEDA